jgi:hypothetical protein
LWPLVKLPTVTGVGRVDTHAQQRRAMRDRRDDQPAIVFEPDEPAIKEMIDTRREEQPLLAVEPFPVRSIAPRIAQGG